MVQIMDHTAADSGVGGFFEVVDATDGRIPLRPSGEGRGLPGLSGRFFEVPGAELRDR
jgi:hypothetical protein